ncbi:MAG: LemA family protein [Verrucomicrobiaceae bacterium]|jgi:LemA protein|nr:LemA family protein [Verrucomicrobiaceae bacterium]
MTAAITILAVLAGLVLVVAFWVIGIYNGLVKLRNLYRNAFAQIDVQLKRRYDLIPNLVETAKSFMKHEKETLEGVIEARNMASSARQSANTEDASSMGALMAAEGGLGSALGRLFALSEAYPDLKSNANMMQVSEELTSTENKIAFSRQAYNDAVTQYNTQTEVFPSSLIAGMFNFGTATLFEVTEESEREAVKVEF